MAPTLFALLLASSPALDAAQTAYVQCLAAESDAALRDRVPIDLFAHGAQQICEVETAAFRAAALPMLRAQMTGVDEATAEHAAGERFAALDAGNRAKLITAYGGKLRARRGGRPQ